MSYRVSTQVYSGPFDLLLQLVTRQKVDIGSISIAVAAVAVIAWLAAGLVGIYLEDGVIAL